MVKKPGFWERRAERKERERLERARRECALPLYGLNLIAERDNRPELKQFVEYMTEALNEGKLPNLEEIPERVKRKFNPGKK